MVTDRVIITIVAICPLTRLSPYATIKIKLINTACASRLNGMVIKIASKNNIKATTTYFISLFCQILASAMVLKALFLEPLTFFDNKRFSNLPSFKSNQRNCLSE